MAKQQRPPHVSATAKAEVSLKASAAAKFERKKIISEQIPEDVTRAKANTWLTIISPITEWAGLKGDQLAHKRTLLRIQQEETLDTIARSASAKLSDLAPPTQPIPPKFLIPFLEKASLEDAGSKLVEMWASLLASAATNYNPHFVHFTNIIAQLSASQAALFERLIGDKGRKRALLNLESLGFHFEHRFLVDFLLRELRPMLGEFKSAVEIFNFISDLICLEGICIVHIDVDNIDKQSDDYIGHIPSKSSYYNDLKDDIDMLILDSSRLISYQDTGDFGFENWKIRILFFHVTNLGFSFAEACGIGDILDSEVQE